MNAPAVVPNLLYLILSGAKSNMAPDKIEYNNSVFNLASSRHSKHRAGWRREGQLTHEHRPGRLERLAAGSVVSFLD